MATGGGGPVEDWSFLDASPSPSPTATAAPAEDWSFLEQPSPSPSPEPPPGQASAGGTAAVSPAIPLQNLTGAQLPPSIVQRAQQVAAPLGKPLYSSKPPKVPKSGTQFINKNDSPDIAAKKSGRIVDEALKRAGTYFNSGTPAQCANWVRDAYAAVGTKLKASVKPLDWNVTKGMDQGPGYANSLMGEDVGEIIRNPADLKPGDVVSFDNTYGNYDPGTITHAGIYIGDGEMVHRPTKDGPVARVMMSDTGMKFRAGMRPYKDVGDTKTMVEGVVRKSGFKSDQDISLMMKLFQAESGFRAHDYNGKVLKSRAGARGIGQVMPATAAPYLARHGWTAEEYDQNPVIQTTIATEITQDLLRRYDGNWAQALAAYNGGPGAVAEAQTNGGWTPNSKIGSWYTETLPYVAKALGASPEQTMKWIADGGGPRAQIVDPGVAEREAQSGFQQAVALSMVPAHVMSMGLTTPLTDPAVQEVNARGGKSPFSALFEDAKESTKYVAHGFLLALDGIGFGLGQGDKALSEGIQSTMGDGILGKGLDTLLGAVNAPGRVANQVTGSDVFNWLKEQTSPSGWQTPQRDFPTQMRGGQDFVTWMLGTMPRKGPGGLQMGPNQLLDANAWEANAWSFGMEFPTLAAQTVALELLGPSQAMFGMAGAGPGLLGRATMKPAANLIGTAGGGGIMWAMANKTGIGRQLGREYFQNIATWGGLGALQAGAIAAGFAIEEGKSPKEVLAAAMVTGMFGYVMGVGIPLGLHAAAQPVKAANTNLLQPAVKKAVEMAANSPVRHQLEKSLGDIIGKLDKATGGKISAQGMKRLFQTLQNTNRIQGEKLIENKMAVMDQIGDQYHAAADNIRKVVADRSAQRDAAIQEVQKWHQTLSSVPAAARTAFNNAGPLEEQIGVLQQALKARPLVNNKEADAAWVQQYNPLAEADKPIEKSRDLVKALETKMAELTASKDKLLMDTGATPEQLLMYQAAEGLLQQAEQKVALFDQDPVLGSLQDIQNDAHVLQHFGTMSKNVAQWLKGGGVSAADPALHKIMEMPPAATSGGVLAPEEFAAVAATYREGIEAIVGARRFLDPLQDYVENITSRTSRALLSTFSPEEYGIRYARLVDEARANYEMAAAAEPQAPRDRPNKGEKPWQFQKRLQFETEVYMREVADYEQRVSDAFKTYKGMLDGQRDVIGGDLTDPTRPRAGIVATRAQALSDEGKAIIATDIPEGLEGLEKLVSEKEASTNAINKELNRANRSLLPPGVKKKDLGLKPIPKPREFTGEGPVAPEKFDIKQWMSQQEKTYYEKLKKYEAAKRAKDAVVRKAMAIRGDEDPTMRRALPPRPIQKKLLALREKENALREDLELINEGPELDLTGTHSKATQRIREASMKQRLQVETALEKVVKEREELFSAFKGDQDKFFKFMKAREEFRAAKDELRANPRPTTPVWLDKNAAGWQQDLFEVSVKAKNEARYNKQQARVNEYQANKAKREAEIAKYQTEMAAQQNQPDVIKYNTYRAAVEAFNELKTLYMDHGVDNGGFVKTNVPLAWVEPGATAQKAGGAVMLEDISPSGNITVFSGHQTLEAAAAAGQNYVEAIIPRDIWNKLRSSRVPQVVKDMLPETFNQGTPGVSAAQQVYSNAVDKATEWYNTLSQSERGNLVANEMQDIIDMVVAAPSQKRLQELEAMSQQPFQSFTQEIPADVMSFLDDHHFAKESFFNLLQNRAPASLREALHGHSFNALMAWDDAIGSGNGMAEVIAADFEKALQDGLSRATMGPKTVDEFRADTAFREQMVDAMQSLTRDPSQMETFLKNHPHMQDSLRTYFGIYNAMERFKILTPELDSFFNDVGFPHIYETLRELSSKSDGRGLSSRLASEHERSFPTLAEARKAYQEAMNGKAGAPAGSVEAMGLMNAKGWKNGEPKTPRAREDFFIDAMPGERVRILGLDPNVPENFARAEQFLKNIALRDPITDPVKILKLQMSAVLRADANRTLIKNLASIPIPGAGINPYTKQPYMMVDYFAQSGEMAQTPGVVPVLQNGEIRANSPYPDQQSAAMESLASDAFGLNEHSVMKFSGVDVPAKNLFIHPDVANLIKNRFQAKAGEVGSVTKSINEMMRAMKLAGSPVIHMNNLYSQHVLALASYAQHTIWQSLKARDLGGVGRGFRDLFLSPMDAAGMVAAGNHIGLDVKLYGDAVRHGVNLVSWNNQAKAVVDQAINHLGAEGPDIIPQEELRGFVNSPQRIMEGAKDQDSVTTKIRGAMEWHPLMDAVKQGSPMAAARALGTQLEQGIQVPLKIDYLANKWALFGPARQAQIAAYNHWAAVFWAERGPGLLDKGMPADAALSLIKREAAQYSNMLTGSMNHYLDPARMRNMTYGNLPVVGNLFAAMAPGWLRVKNHQMMAVFDGIVEDTWLGRKLLRQPIEATGGVTEFARVMDPSVKEFLRGQWQRTFATGMVGGLGAMQLMSMMINNGLNTWQMNPRNPTSLTVGDKTYQWPFWGANKEAIKLMQNGATANLEGLIEQVSNNMFSPITEGIIDLGRNQDRMGNMIYNPENSVDTMGERGGDMIKYLASRALNLQEIAGIRMSPRPFSGRRPVPEWLASLVGLSPANAPTPSSERAEHEEAKRWYSGIMAAELAEDLQLYRRSQDSDALDRILQKAMIEGIPVKGKYAKVMEMTYGDTQYRMSGEQVKTMLMRQIDPLGQSLKGLSPPAKAAMWERVAKYQEMQAAGPGLEWLSEQESEETTP